MPSIPIHDHSRANPGLGQAIWALLPHDSLLLAAPRAALQPHTSTSHITTMRDMMTPKTMHLEAGDVGIPLLQLCTAGCPPLVSSGDASPETIPFLLQAGNAGVGHLRCVCSQPVQGLAASLMATMLPCELHLGAQHLLHGCQ